jgi:D-alanyl-D-alanine carboxypeptidase (penicillin-binding protein 5/6)
MGCETSKKLFAACKTLLDHSFANYTVVTAELSGPVEVAVKLGKQERVKAVPGQSAPLLIDKAHKNSVSTEIELEELVAAPVSKGQKIGTMTVRVGERILTRVPMVAETAVERLTYGDIFMMVLRRLVLAK